MNNTSTSVKKSGTWRWVVIFVVVAVVAGGVGYGIGWWLTRSTDTGQPADSTATTPTPATSATPDTSATTDKTTTATAAVPALAARKDALIFTSTKLGLSFYYPSKGISDLNGDQIKVQEGASKLFVYPASFKAEDGQSIEMFSKSATDTLAQAIEKKFLVGIAKTDCFVRDKTVKGMAKTIKEATIGYPVPANAENPDWSYGDQCPEQYKESNGVSYFLMDTTHPDRFYYLSIGQYAIPAYNTGTTTNWQETIVVTE